MAVDRIGKFTPQSDIAIIGIACRVPGAEHYEALWNNLAGGVHSVTELSPDRWDTGQYYSADPNEPNKSVSKWCGQISGVKQFDNQFFQISPREARNMDPQQRLLLEEAWHCMEDSGVPLTELQARITSVYIGVMTGDYKQEALTTDTDVESYACLGNYEGMLANRISHVFQLKGMSSSLNAACASSLVAIHEAKRSLRSGECDYALAGGVSLNLHPWKYIAFSKSRMLSPTGVCRTFDKDADGYVPGDGVGLVLMQRLEDAIRDGNHIYGIVKGSAVNHVGKSHSITAPSVESQRDVIVSAYADAGRSPKSATYVEAHGTGTSLGDPIEIEGLTQAFRQYTDREQYCKIGSIKTNIGHLEAAAGVAGVIKVLLMMKNRQIPPSLHVRQLNPIIDFDHSPFKLATDLTAWEPPGRGMPLLAGVSSLGFGGVNAHVLLEEAPKTAVRRSVRRAPSSSEEPYVFALSAQSDEALARLIEEWRGLLDSGHLNDTDWRDISYTLLMGRTSMSNRIAASVRNTAELGQFLRSAQAVAAGGRHDRIRCLRIGNLQWRGYRFAGQLSRYSLSFRQALGSVTGIVKSHLGRTSLNGFKQEDWDDHNRPLFSFIVAYALLSSWKSAGLDFDRITGEQSGVWAALALSGIVKVEQAASVLSGASQLSEVQLSRPEAAFYDWANGRVLERMSFHELYLQKLAEAAGNGDDQPFTRMLKERMDKAKLLIDNQFTFRKYVGEWNESFISEFGYSLFDIITGIVPWSAADPLSCRRDRMLGLVLVSSFRRLSRKWDLQTRSDHSDPLLTELADLVEDGILPKEDAAFLLLDEAPDWSGIADGMNSRIRLLNRSRTYSLLNKHNRTLSEIVRPADWIEQLMQRWNRDEEIDADGVYSVSVGNCSTSDETLSYVPQEDRVMDDARAFAVQLWLSGWELRWDRLLSYEGAKKVPLPVYPFRRQSHWWANTAKSDKLVMQGTSSGSDTEAEALHTLFHRMGWQAAGGIGHASFSNVTASIVVLDDSERLASQLREQRGDSGGAVIWVKPSEHDKQTGEWNYEINLAEEETFITLFEHLNRRGIQYAHLIHNGSNCSEDGADSEGDLQGDSRHAEALQRGIYSLYAITKAFYSSKHAGTVRLLYLYVKEGRDWPLHAAAAGLARTLRQENVNLRYTMLEHESGLPDHDKAAMCLAAFAADDVPSCELSFRGGSWFARTLQPFEPASSEASIRLKDDGVYLITGGAGGLGLLAAARIASYVRAKLVLAGRSAWKEELAGKLEELRRLGGEAVYVQADVSSLHDTRRLIEHTKDQFGSVDGIIHCAGLYESGFAYRRTREQIAAVIAPKVYGAHNLDEATRTEPLDFFILFSSISGVVGDIGLSDYAFSNCYLDHFAELRNSRRADGVRSGLTLSIDWPLWQDGGIQIGGTEAARYQEATGQRILPAHAGLQAFDTVLANVPGHQVLVSYGDVGRISSVLAQHYAATAPTVKTVEAEHSSNRSGKPNAAPAIPSRRDRTPIASTEATVFMQRTTELLTGILAAELGLPETDIDPKEKFEQYGIDSILIHHVNARLEQALGPVSKTVLFEYSNLTELSEYLVLHHRQELAGLFSLFGTSTAEAASAMEDTAAPPYEDAETTVQPKVQEGVNTRPQADSGEKTMRGAVGRQDIAVIGAAGRYPDADNLAQLWANLVNGRDSITDVPKDRWDVSAYYDADPARSAEGTTYCRSGGFIRGVDQFDPLFFKLSPKEAELMDPQERLFLEIAWEAFEDAGYSMNRLLESTGGGRSANVGVFVGVTTNSYSLNGPDLWRQNNGAIPLSMPWSIANRVSYVMNFDGPSMPVDTACASSLSAVALACDSIWNGDCAMALAGGVNLYLHPSKFVWLSQMRMISPNGRCFTFSDQADGFGPGEGVGAVVLKPLADAVRDRDPIYGVIKAAATNHGGKTNGYTVPNPNAQASLVSKALRQANIDPRTVSYIEAHGTGTLLGDPIEINGLTRAFREGTDDTQFCAIGSVKTNIGHLESAAGIAGLTKLLLQLKYRKLVPSLHAAQLNPNIDFYNSPFYVQRRTEEWKRPVIEVDGVLTEYPRRAGISSFGAGGANAHVVVEEYLPYEQSNSGLMQSESAGSQLVVLSAKSKAQLKQYAERLAAHWTEEAGGRTGTRLLTQTGEQHEAEHDDDRMRERLLRMIAERLGIEQDSLDISVPLTDYGLDPLDAAVLSELISREVPLAVVPPELLVASTIESLMNQLLPRRDRESSSQLAGVLEHAGAAGTDVRPSLSVSLADIAYTTQVGRTEMEERAAFVAADIQDLLGKLAAYANGKLVRGVYEDSIRNGRATAGLLEGAAGAAFMNHVMAEWDLDMMAKLWTSGVAIDWDKLHEGAERRCVSLPTYPFARERYWLPELSGSISPSAPLQRRVETNGPKREAYVLNKTWQTTVSPSEHVGPIPGLTVVIVNEESIPLLYNIRFAQSPIVVLAEEGDGLGSPERPDARGFIAFNRSSAVDGAKTAERIVLSHAVTGLLDLSDLYERRQAMDAGHSGTRAMLQTLLLHRRHEPFTLIHVTNGLQTFGMDCPTMAGAAIASFVKMLAAEYVKLRSKTVDIDAVSLSSVGAALDRIVCGEWEAPQAEGEVLYRNGQRYAPIMTLAANARAEASALAASIEAEPFRPILITGGMRGIGAELAKHLAANKARRFVLMGLSPMPPRSEWDNQQSELVASRQVQERIGLVRQLEQLGAEVELYGGTLTDRAAVASFLDRVRGQWGPIGGVFHCAGSNYSEHPAFIHKQEQAIATVMEPKTEGLHVLSECLQGDGLSYFVLFSSISAVIPELAAGLSDYAAANAYMDYYAAYQHAQGIGYFRSVNWPSWKEVGMGEVTTSRYQNTGLLTHTTEEGLMLLHAVLSQQGSAVYTPCMSGEQPLRTDRWLLASKIERSALPEAAWPLPMASVAAERRPGGEQAGGSFVLEKLRELFAQALRLDPAQMDAHTPFGDFGMESVLLNDMVHTIDQWAGTKLDPTVLLENPTLDSLSRYLIEQAGVADAIPEQQTAPALVLERATAPVIEPVPVPEQEQASTPRHLSEQTRPPIAEPLQSIAAVAPNNTPHAGRPVPIAVIGMAAHLPGARDIEQFWRNLASGTCSITEVPSTRWSAERLYSPAYERGKTISKWGGFIEDIELFDPAYFGLNEQEAEQFDPLVRQFLEVAAQTIRHAGYEDKELSGRKIGVFVGSRAGAYAPRLGLPTKGTILGIGQNFIAAHLAHHYNLKGPNLVVDTACSSSLVSVHLACQSLLAGESEMAIAGGVDILLDEQPYLILSEAKALSPDGRCHTFDEKANGFVPGEGSGAVMLKRLDDAVRDGDHIYAVIDGSAVNNDGRTMGVTTPNPIAQQEVIAEAVAKSGIDAATISLVETHGTGTMIGDPIELRALTSVFRSVSDETQYCAVGSVKTNVGHLLSAAGIASLIKIVLSIGRQQIPPTLHCETPNPRFAFNASPFYPAVKLQDWMPRKGIRRAGISSFGFGGTNAHLIVSEYKPASSTEAAVRQPLPPITFNRKRYWVMPNETETARQQSDGEQEQDIVIPFMQLERIQ